MTSDVIVTGYPVTMTSLFFKMDARFAVVTEEEIEKVEEGSISYKTKQATKYGVKIFQGKIFYLALLLSS